MCKRFCASLCLLLFSVLPAYSITLADIHIMTEEFPPYNYMEHGKFKGVATELLFALYKRVDVPLSHANIELVSWERGFQDVQTKAGTMLFSMIRSQEREDQFKWVGPIVPTRTVLLGRKIDNITITTAEEITQYTIGTTRDSASEMFLKRLNVPASNLEYSSSEWGNILKLQAGKIDFIITDSALANWLASLQGMSESPFKQAFLIEKNAIYYAFHRRTPDSIITTLQRALDDMKHPDSQGTSPYLRLLARHNMAP